MRAEEAYVLSKHYADGLVIEAGALTGVKGDTEEDYRQGNVNLTAENIGVVPITNGQIDDLDE